MDVLWVVVVDLVVEDEVVVELVEVERVVVVDVDLDGGIRKIRIPSPTGHGRTVAIIIRTVGIAFQNSCGLLGSSHGHGYRSSRISASYTRTTYVVRGFAGDIGRSPCAAYASCAAWRCGTRAGDLAHSARGSAGGGPGQGG